MLRSYFLFATLPICGIVFGQNEIQPDTSQVIFANAETASTESITSTTSQTNFRLPDHLFLPEPPRYNPRHRIKQPSEDYGLLAFTTGTWIPMGWNQVLGVHPAFGLMLGSWHNRTLYELNMEFRVGSADRNY